MNFKQDGYSMDYTLLRYVVSHAEVCCLTHLHANLRQLDLKLLARPYIMAESAE